MHCGTLKQKLPAVFSSYCQPGSEPICRHTCTMKTEKVKQLHYHKCIEIGYCVQGTGTCYVDNRVYRYRPGDLQIILPYQPHIAVGDAEGQSIWNYVSVEPYKLFIMVRFFGVDTINDMLKKEIKYTGLFSPDEHPEIKKLVFRLSEEVVQTKKHKLELCAALLYELLIYLSNLSGDATRPTFVNPNIEKINLALERIQEGVNQMADIRVEQLAEECGMSVSNFRLVFKSVTGFSPKEYVINLRLNYAEHLLLNTQYSVQAISDMAGFSTPANFYSKFQKCYGMTPKAYRESAQALPGGGYLTDSPIGE